MSPIVSATRRVMYTSTSERPLRDALSCSAFSSLIALSSVPQEDLGHFTVSIPLWHVLRKHDLGARLHPTLRGMCLNIDADPKLVEYNPDMAENAPDLAGPPRSPNPTRSGPSQG